MDKAWEYFILAVAMPTYATIKESPEGGGKSMFVLTSKEKAALVSKIQKLFGPLSKKKNYGSVEVAAFSLLKFLNSKWPTSETKRI